MTNKLLTSSEEIPNSSNHKKIPLHVFKASSTNFCCLGCAETVSRANERTFFSSECDGDLKERGPKEGQAQKQSRLHPKVEAWCNDSELSRGYERHKRGLRSRCGEVIPRRKLDVPMYVRMLLQHDLSHLGLGRDKIARDNRVSLKYAIDGRVRELLPAKFARPARAWRFYCRKVVFETRTRFIRGNGTARGRRPIAPYDRVMRDVQVPKFL